VSSISFGSRSPPRSCFAMSRSRIVAITESTADIRFCGLFPSTSNGSVNVSSLQHGCYVLGTSNVKPAGWSLKRSCQ
jgi:hypothetical protein